MNITMTPQTVSLINLITQMPSYSPTVAIESKFPSLFNKVRRFHSASAGYSPALGEIVLALRTVDKTGLYEYVATELSPRFWVAVQVNTTADLVPLMGDEYDTLTAAITVFKDLAKNPHRYDGDSWFPSGMFDVHITQGEFSVYAMVNTESGPVTETDKCLYGGVIPDYLTSALAGYRAMTEGAGS
jgi:hypothetical protein